MTSFNPPKTDAYIYALADSLDGVFYIGQGQGRRIDQHEDEARRGACGCKKCGKIRSIWSLGGKVLKYKIYENLNMPRAQIDKLEKAIILTYGQTTLLNQVWATIPVDPIYQMIPKSVIIPFASRKAIYPYIEKQMRSAGMEVNQETVKEYLTKISTEAIMTHVLGDQIHISSLEIHQDVEEQS